MVDLGWKDSTEILRERRSTLWLRQESLHIITVQIDPPPTFTYSCGRMDFTIPYAADALPQIRLSAKLDYALMFIDAFHHVPVFTTGQEDPFDNVLINKEYVGYLGLMNISFYL